MKLKLYTLVFLSALFLTSLQAQDYLISFEGSGASATVATVKVENLTQNTELTMNGSDILHLKNVITGINSYIEDSNQRISFSPNPMIDYSLIKFNLPEDGQTTTSLYDITGMIILQIQDYLNKGHHTYRIQGLNNGLYIAKVTSNRYSLSGRLLCSGSQIGDPKIIYENVGATEKKEYDSKGISAETVMQYNAGDRLKLTGISDIYSTIITDVPIESKTITFNFITCTDGEGNNYPIVQIGTQIWMAVNLKTTKYNDGTAIPLETDLIWYYLTTPAYCWYHNDEATYKNTYGALYNWYTVNNGKLCPSGWYVPTDADWTTLTTFLGGESIASGKLKETGTTHWNSPNAGATNMTGFTALPGGTRSGPYSEFFNVGLAGVWWSSTESAPKVYYRVMDYNTILAGRISTSKTEGFSVRCLKIQPPSVITVAISNITSNTATSGGNVKSDGGATITVRGVCWSTSPNPTVANSITIDGSGTGTFVSNLTDLAANTSYYVRAYATTNEGTGYGDEVTFKTTFNLPTLSTEPITEKSYTTAKSGGNITSDGGSTVIARGVCWSTSVDPTIEDNKTIDGAGGGSFVSMLTDLTPNTPYYVRAYATNAAGTAYGMALAFTALSLPPALGLVAYYPFNGNANDESGNGNNGTVNGATLTTDRFGNPNCAYSFDGINDGISGSTTNWPYSNSPRTISLWGYIHTLPTANGFFLTYGQQTTSHINSVYFQYVEGFGKTVVYAGFLDDIQTLYNYSLDTWYHIVATFNGTIAKIYVNGIFVSEANKSNWNTLSSAFHFGSLDNGTSFLNGAVDDIRIYDRVLTNYEIEQLFKEDGYTPKEVVTDVDGNIYNTVKIGTKVWMAENLKTTKYSNGDLISTTTPTNLDISGETMSKYQWAYEGTDSNVDIYGRLFTWYTITDARKICPIGWHIPSDEEWTILATHLGGESVAGGYMKETGSTHWISPNVGASNTSGFTGLPGGTRYVAGNYGAMGHYGYFWAITQYDDENGLARDLDRGDTKARRTYSPKKSGLSIRCLKD